MQRSAGSAVLIVVPMPFPRPLIGGVRPFLEVTVSITWSDITVSLEGLAAEDLLADRRWQIGASYQPIVLTAMGDLFLLDADQSVYWLDVASGRLHPISDSRDAFQRMINGGDHASRWFMPEVVLALKGAGVGLGRRQVYSLTHPAILGGQYEFGNIRPTDVGVHMSIYGQIHRQVKDLPPGTKITDVCIE